MRHHHGVVFATLLTVVATAAAQNYHVSDHWQVGGEGGWDILTIDSNAGRLYLSHATKVVVVDLSKSGIAGEIADTPGVHGFVAVPEFQRAAPRKPCKSLPSAL